MVTKESFSSPQLKRALPFFCLLWGVGLALSLLFLFLFRAQLLDLDRFEVERLLQSYISESRSGGSGRIVNPGSGFWSREGLLPAELSFVRLFQGGDQVFLVGKDFHGVQFKVFATIPETYSSGWFKFTDPHSGRHWQLTLARISISDTVFVQAAKDSQKSYALFTHYVRVIVWVNIVLFFVCWLLALLWVHLTLKPFVTMKEKIERISSGEAEGLQLKAGAPRELDELYFQINKVLRHNRKLVSEIQQSLDNVAHDLRTPMTRLRSVAEYGLQADDDVALLRESLGDCLEESERVLSMLRIMMSVAEAESGTMKLEMQECDIVKSLEHAAVLYEYVAEEKNISIAMDTPASLIVTADETRISQVWANLLDNAVKYGRVGGWVRISASENERGVVVVFQDNGMGISRNEQSRIWERLYRGDRSRSEQGLGLGLNYVKAVIEAHGGTIQLKSELNSGSSFEVFLPG